MGYLADNYHVEKSSNGGNLLVSGGANAQPATSGKNFFNDFLARGGGNTAGLNSFLNNKAAEEQASENAKKTVEDNAIENAKRMAVQGDERKQLEQRRADLQKQLDDLNSGAVSIYDLFPKQEAEFQKNMKRSELQYSIEDIDRRLAKEYGNEERIGDTLKGWWNATKGAYKMAAATAQDFAKQNESRIARDAEYTGINNDFSQPFKGLNIEERGLNNPDKTVDLALPENKKLESTFDGVINWREGAMEDIAKGTQQKQEAKEGTGAVGSFLLDALSTGLDIGADTALSLIPGMQGAGLYSMATRVFGNAAAESATNGDNLETQVAKGVTAALIESLTEKIGGGFDKAYGSTISKAIAQKLGKNAATAATKAVNANRAAIMTMLKESGSEALEEALADVLNIAADHLFGWSGDEKTFLEELSDSKSEILYDALLGGFIGMFGAAGDAINTKQSAEARNKAIADGVDAAIQNKQNVNNEQAENIGSAEQATKTPADILAEAARPTQENQLTPAENHIDNRTFSSVADKKTPSFQYEHPELHNYFVDAAKLLIGEVDSALAKDKVQAHTKGKRSYSEPINRLVDYGMSKPRIMQCLMDIIQNHGAENYADAKRVEIVLDDMLSNGWRGTNREAHNASNEYINAKGNISGRKDTSSWESYLDEHYLSILDGLVTEEELRTEWESLQSQSPSAVNALMDAATRGNANAAQNANNPPANAQNASNEFIPAEQQSEAQTGATAFKMQSDADESGGNVRERGYSANLASDKAMNEAIQAEYKSAPDFYAQKSNAETLKAAEVIYRQGIDKAESTLREALANAKNGMKLSAEMVPLSRLVANDLAANGRIDTARELLSDIGAELTYAGQLGQSAHILRNADPITKALSIKKMVDKLNNQIGNTRKKMNVKRGRGDAQGNIVVDETLINNFIKAKDDASRDSAIDAIETDIARQIPATFADKFVAMRYLNMLGNFKTQGRNILGNTAMGLLTTAKRHVVQSTIELINAAVTGNKNNRNTVLFYAPSLYKEANADFANISSVAMGEAKYNANSPISSSRINAKREVFDRNIPLLSSAAQKYNAATRWAMEMGDQIFIRANYADAMAGWMQGHGFNSISEMSPEELDAARAFAIKEAQEATFRDQNNVSNFVKNFDKNWDKKYGTAGKVAKTAIEGIIPFRATPANVAVRGVEYSPIGLAIGIGKALSGKADSAKAINDISKGATGSALAVAGFFLAAAGKARGNEDDEKLEAFQKLQGQSDYSINVNGKWVSLSQLAPASIPFFMGVILYERLSEQESFSEMTLDDYGKMLGAITDPMLEMSMLSGVNDALNNIASFNGDADALPKFFTNSVLGYLSQGLSNTLLSQAASAMFENRQTFYKDKDSFLGEYQYTLAKYAAKFPGTDYNRQDYVDAWGRKQSNGSVGERLLDSFINPVYVSDEKRGDVEKELERLYQDNPGVEGVGSVFPSKASRSLTYGTGKDGEPITMTADEYEQYSVDRGQASLKYVSDFMNSAVYKDMTDEERISTIKELYSFAADRALAKVKGKNGVKNTSDFETLIKGIDKPGTSNDKTPLPEKDVPTYIAYKNQFKYAKDNDDYAAQDKLLKQYTGLPESIQTAMLEHGVVSNSRLKEYKCGIDSASSAAWKEAKESVQARLDKNSSNSGIVELFALAESDIPQAQKQAIIDNYADLGYLSKSTATAITVLSKYGYDYTDIANFFYGADYKTKDGEGKASGTLDDKKLSYALSQLTGLSDKERDTIYKEFKAVLDTNSAYPWRDSYSKALKRVSSNNHYGTTFGRPDSDFASITRKNPGADLLLDSAKTSKKTKDNELLDFLVDFTGRGNVW